MQIQTLLLIAPPILLALTFHEFAHAYVANRFGDDTAKQSGRLSLNPLRHLDPLGTIMIFLVHFGWAKPVPVNPYRLKNPKKDMLWISAAGPACKHDFSACQWHFAQTSCGHSRGGRSLFFHGFAHLCGVYEPAD